MKDERACDTASAQREDVCSGFKGCLQGGMLCTSKISIFQGLSEEAQLNLIRIAQHRNFRRGESVFCAEDSADSILIVRFGRIKLSRFERDGQEFVLGILAKGDVMGETTLYRGERRGMEGTALEDCGICLVSAHEIAGVVLRQPDMGVRLLRSIGGKLNDAQQLMGILSRKYAQARLAGFLLFQAERAGGGLVELSHEDIAASVNLSRETVTRRLDEMEHAGLISLPGRCRILLVDRTALQAVFLQDTK